MLRVVGSTSIFRRILPRSCLHTTTPDVIQAMRIKFQGKENFEQAVRLEIIDLSTLKLYPAIKVAEISALFEQQKHYPDALGFINQHELLSIDRLMACELGVIKAYKAYLYQLSPANLRSGAYDIESWRKLPVSIQTVLITTNEDTEAYFRPAPGCGC